MTNDHIFFKALCNDQWPLQTNLTPGSKNIVTGIPVRCTACTDLGNPRSDIVSKLSTCSIYETDLFTVLTVFVMGITIRVKNIFPDLLQPRLFFPLSLIAFLISFFVFLNTSRFDGSRLSTEGNFVIVSSIGLLCPQSKLSFRISKTANCRRNKTTAGRKSATATV